MIKLASSIAATASLVLVLAAAKRRDPEEIGSGRTDEVLLAAPARIDPEIGSKTKERLTQTNFCAPARCGTSWAEANSKCGVNCEEWNGPDWEDIWCGAGEQCWADLDVSLPCCEDPTVVQTSPPVPAPEPNFCASARCGTSWAEANFKCGVNCEEWDGPDWKDIWCGAGEQCWADLDLSLPCCEDATVVRTSAPAPAPPPSTCSTVRCGTDWANANSKCGMECLPYDPAAAEEYVDLCAPFGESCYADLDDALSCCYEEPTEITFAPMIPPEPAPTLRPTRGPMSNPTPKPTAPPIPQATPRPTLRPTEASTPITTVATELSAPLTSAPLPIPQPTRRPTLRPTGALPPTTKVATEPPAPVLQPNPQPTLRPTRASPPTTTVATEPPAPLTAAPLPILKPNPSPTEPPVFMVLLTRAPIPAPREQLPVPTQQPSMGPTLSLTPSTGQMPTRSLSTVPTLSQQPSSSRSPSGLPSVEPTASLEPSEVPSLQQINSTEPMIDIVEANTTTSLAAPSGAPSQQPSAQVFADSRSGNSAVATTNGGGEDKKSAGEIAGYAAIAFGVVAAIAVIVVIAWKRHQRKVETDQAKRTSSGFARPILDQQPNTVSDVFQVQQWSKARRFT